MAIVVGMATKSEMLAEAQAAYHSLQIGEAVVRVRDQSGELVEYKPADAGKLLVYINKLQNEINGVAASGPMRFLG